MKPLAILALLVALAASAPTSEITSNELTSTSDTTEQDGPLVIDSSFFNENFTLFSAEHEIVSLLFPINELNFEEDEDTKIIFYVEADIVDGKKDYKGLSIYNNGTITKLLETGTSSAFGESKKIYFGATDGIYSYNAEKNIAEKYGTIDDNIIEIDTANATDDIYILNTKNELYKVSEEGTKKELIDAHMVEQFVLDYADNIYYFCDEKKVHVITESGKIIVEGLPEDRSYIQLVSPPFIIEDGVIIIVGNKSFTIYNNGTVEDNDIIVDAKPSAYSVQGALIQYYAYNKSVYEYNILDIIFKKYSTELSNFLNSLKDDISEIATRSLPGL